MYYVYPHGKAPGQSVCSSVDFDYPCFKFAINQARHQNKWLQLTVNKGSNTIWQFIQNIGYVKVSANNVDATEKLAVGEVRFDPVYPSDYVFKWRRMIFYVSSMKLAISECLNDHSGNFTFCDSTTELERYGIAFLPLLADATLTIVAGTAAIEIAGNAQMAGCTFQLRPDVSFDAGTISWNTVATAVTKPGTSIANCAKFVTGSTIAP